MARRQAGATAEADQAGGTILPPSNDNLKGRTVEVWVFVDERGRVVADSTKRAEVADVLGHLSYAYLELGRIADAEGAARRSYDVTRDALGPRHTRTALAATRLSQIFDAQQRYDEAEPLLRESIVVMEATAGPDHTQTLTVRNNLAVTLAKLGRFEEAAETHRELIRIRSVSGAGRQPSRELASSHQNLAAMLTRLGRYAEADSLAERAYALYLETTPEGHYLRGLPLLTRSEVLLLDGRPEEAMRTAGQALRILESAMSAGHYTTEVARCRLGTAQVRSGLAAAGRASVDSAFAALRRSELTPPEYLEECRRARDAVMATDAGRG